MFASNSLATLELHLTVLSLVGGAVTQSLIGLWAANSTRHWFWRALAVWGAVTALIPIRAYEPALVFAVSSPLTIVIIQISRFVASRRQPTACQPSGAPRLSYYRFRLSDLFLLILILSISLTSLLHLLKHAPAMRWTDVLLPARVVVAVTCLSHFAALGPRRILALVALAGSIAASTWLLWPSVKWLYKFDALGLTYYEILGTTEDDYRVLAVTALALGELAAAIIVALIVVRTTSPARWRRLTSRLVQAAFGGAALALALLYWQMLWLSPLPPAPPTADNHFPEILRIAERVQAINPSSLSIADLRAADPAVDAPAELEVLYRELGPFLEKTNAIPLAPENCTDEFFSGPHTDRFQTFRVLGRSLQAEGKAAAANNDFVRAADFARADLRLGIMLCRGGLHIDLLIGHAIINSHGTSHLAAIRDRLDPATARSLIGDLQRLEGEFEPLDAIFDRDVAFCQRAFGWTTNLDQIIARLLYGPPPNWPSTMAIPQAQTRTLAINHLLQNDLAIRLCQTEQGRLPHSLSELVPDYLPEMPLDPFSGRPLIYRAAEGQFLLYSVGQDNHDDGGQFANWPTHNSQSGYDFDLDTLTRP